MIKEGLRVTGYVRYMDDMLIFSDRKVALWGYVDDLRGWLDRERNLALKDEAFILAPCTEGIPFLGMRIFPGRLRLQHNRFWRTRRLVRKREKQYLAGEITEEQLSDSVTAVCGMLKFFGLKNIVHTEVDI